MPRIWTVAEANAAIPRVRQVLGDARAAQSRMRDEEAQVEDIRIIWGEQVKEPSCPDHAEFNERIARLALAKNELEQHSLQFEVIGCEVKDLDQGLVDFRGKLGSEEVYLCWRDGEGDIRFWHPLQGGFAQRRAIPGLR